MFDHNLPAKLARGMDRLSLSPIKEVVPKNDLFPDGTPDLVWIQSLNSEPGWGVVTHDRLNKGLEAKAVAESGLLVFKLTNGWSDLDYWAKCQKMTKLWPLIEQCIDWARPGSVFKIPVNFSTSRTLKPYVETSVVPHPHARRPQKTVKKSETPSPSVSSM